MATPSGRVNPLVVQPAAACRAGTCPGQPAAARNAATRPKKRATRPASGTKVAISWSRRLHVGEVHRIAIPAIQPSPLATGPKMISHGAHASQRRLSGAAAPGRGVPAVARAVGIEPVPSLFDMLVHVGE